MSKGTLFILTGPSGAGKDTVLSRLKEINDNVFLSVSATTRQPREGENHGEHYYFIERDMFEDMITKGEFLEYAEYVGNYYGTPCAPVDKMLSEGKDVILKIEIVGAMKVKEQRPDAVSVFIVPPSFEVLESRLRKRGTDDEETIKKRLIRAKEEYLMAPEFDYIIINDSVESAVEELCAIIMAQRCRSDKRYVSV